MEMEMELHKSGLTKEELGDMQESMREFESFFPKYVSPVFKKMLSGALELKGSGFIIEKDNGLYFVTAAHVYDHHSTDEPLVIFKGQTELLQLNGNSKKTASNKINREDDQLDIAVISLPLDSWETLSEIDKEIIVMQQIDCDTASIPDCRFIVAGYPLTKNEPDIKAKTINPVCYVWIAKSVAEDSYKRRKLCKSKNLLIQFNQKNTMRSDGVEGHMFPEPRGISGAPVWRTVGRRNHRGLLVVDGALVVGVLIEHIKEEKSFLVTSIDVVISMINELER